MVINNLKEKVGQCCVAQPFLLYLCQRNRLHSVS
uniref:Uncharacterized protein n=1 Tax=Siphoviridae sp. ctKwY15 TaxID=2827843 RepID=A0A8S5STS6_9CAUD|nr:MAG TPA: hypothetical protein [Siphoviridae sp. ctKwY15]